MNSPGGGQRGRRPQVVSSGRGQAGSCVRCVPPEQSHLNCLLEFTLQSKFKIGHFASDPDASTGRTTEELVLIS